jgi:hypothetical protein
VFRRTWWPHQPSSAGRRSRRPARTERYPGRRAVAGLVVYPLRRTVIFANARMYGEASGDRPGAPGPAMDRHRRRAHHRRRHHGLRHAARARPLAQPSAVCHSSSRR